MINSKSRAIFASASSEVLCGPQNPLRNIELARTQTALPSASAHRQQASFASARRRSPALRRRNADAEISAASSASKCVERKRFWASQAAADDADANFRAL
jgi:hypothetical protein